MSGFQFFAILMNVYVASAMPSNGPKLALVAVYAVCALLSLVGVL